MTGSTKAEHDLMDARRRADKDDIAEALTVHANELVQQGQIAKARQELDEASKIHHEQGRTYDEARCTQFAATLSRLEGNLVGARERAMRASELAEPDSPIAVSARTELGEIALAEANGDEAEKAYALALAYGRVAGLIESAQAALLRKRAIALAMDNRHSEAVEDLTEAYGLHAKSGEQTEAIRTLVEKASAWQQGGFIAEADQATAEAITEAQKEGDDHALADLYLLRSAQAIERKDVKGAITSAISARDYALAAVAPMSYLGAVVAIAELAEFAGDYLDAYEALGVGWVTLADLLGEEAARGAFEPKLLELRSRIGPERFDKVKATYEAKRRAEKGNK